MAYYKNLVPVDGPASNYLTPTTACFAEAQGVDVKSLKNPQQDTGVADARVFDMDGTRDRKPAGVQVFTPDENNTLATNIVASQATSVGSPGAPDEGPFTSIAAQGMDHHVTRLETRIVDKSNPGLPETAVTNFDTGETKFEVRAEKGGMKQIDEKSASDRLRTMHQRATACLSQF